MPQPMNPDSAEHVKRCPTPPSRMGLPNVAHLPRAARRAAPHHTPRSSSRVRGRCPPRPPGTHSSHQRATPRAYHLRKTGGWRRPHSQPSEGSSCAAVAAARAALVPGGEARTTASDREARRGARRAESPSDDRVRRCGAPSSTEQRSRRGDRTVRGARAARGRRADEPAAREEERGRGVRKQGAEARRCGVLEPRAEAPGRESTRRLS